MYDQGEYICVAENSVGRIDAAANIVVVPDPNSRRSQRKLVAAKALGRPPVLTGSVG